MWATNRVARSPVFYGISRISACSFTIYPMSFSMKITIFFESPVFSTPDSGNPSDEYIDYHHCHRFLCIHLLYNKNCEYFSIQNMSF